MTLIFMINYDFIRNDDSVIPAEDTTVIPAQAGIQLLLGNAMVLLFMDGSCLWIPACAGMTGVAFAGMTIAFGALGAIGGFKKSVHQFTPIFTHYPIAIREICVLLFVKFVVRKHQ